MSDTLHCISDSILDIKDKSQALVPFFVAFSKRGIFLACASLLLQWLTEKLTVEGRGTVRVVSGLIKQYSTLSV